MRCALNSRNELVPASIPTSRAIFESSSSIECDAFKGARGMRMQGRKRSQRTYVQQLSVFRVALIDLCFAAWVGKREQEKDRERERERDAQRVVCAALLFECGTDIGCRYCHSPV